MNDPKSSRLPPRQQLVKADKWPLVGELPPSDWDRPWTLSIEGGCSAPRTWSLTELQQGFKIDQTLDIHCVTRWSKFDMKVTGVPLLRLMKEVRPNSDIKFASFVARSDRNHSTSLSLKDIQRIQPMVAWEVDGVPLTKEHGGPLRLITPGKYFYKSLKWLERIELLVQDRLGYWERESGYHNHADPWKEERYIASQLSKKEVSTLIQNLDITQQKLLGFDVQDRRLDGLKAQGSKLRDSNFRSASLIRADFRSANLSNANLAHADLTGAKFDDADLEGADFCGANLSDASFRNASLFGATFIDEQNQQAAKFSSENPLTSKQISMLTDEQQAYFRKRFHVSE